ncbi:MAG: J domain-containing protein [Fluviibacter phosphoraccumulans]
MNETPETIELQRLKTDQTELEINVADSELEHGTLKTETARFKQRYYQTVGRLYAELDDWIAKVARAQAGKFPKNEELETEAKAAEKQAEKSAEEAGIKEPVPEPLPEITPELKQLFRKAAMLIHPDRATTDQERQRRTVLMAQINCAYEKGNQAEIEKIVSEFGQDPEAIAGDDVGSQIVKAIRRIAQLKRRLGELLGLIDEIRQSEIHELRTTVEESEALGGDPLGDLAKQLMKDISEQRVEFETMRR